MLPADRPLARKHTARPAQALGLLGGTLALAVAGAAWWRFRADMLAAEARLAGASQVIPTPFGSLEYAERGQGAPVLMLHGTGGGFDQGLDMSAALQAHGFRVIAPSRFGYLRSDFPADASAEAQADALIFLLDRLGIDRIAIAGGSAGALAAVQFALRHPRRCSALVLLVPAANVTGRDPVEMTRVLAFLVQNVLGSNALLWAARKLAPRFLVRSLLATDPALLDRVSASERARALAILDRLLPVSRRRKGLLNDARLAGASHAVDYRRVEAPALILSVEDDRFGTAATARYLASEIPGASLVVLPRGGHVWLGADDMVHARVAQFLRGCGVRSGAEATNGAR